MLLTIRVCTIYVYCNIRPFVLIVLEEDQGRVLLTADLEFNNAERINQSPHFSHLLDSTFRAATLRKDSNPAREHRLKSEIFIASGAHRCGKYI